MDPHSNYTYNLSPPVEYMYGPDYHYYPQPYSHQPPPSQEPVYYPAPMNQYPYAPEQLQTAAAVSIAAQASHIPTPEPYHNYAIGHHNPTSTPQRSIQHTSFAKRTKKFQDRVMRLSAASAAADESTAATSDEASFDGPGQQGKSKERRAVARSEFLVPDPSQEEQQPLTRRGFILNTEENIIHSLANLQPQPPTPKNNTTNNPNPPLHTAAPPPEKATLTTPLKQLCFPATLERANVANQHKWTDKGIHSPKTVFVVTHQIGSEISDMRTFSSIKEANREVFTIMAKSHPEVFVALPKTKRAAAVTPVKEEDEEPQTLETVLKRMGARKPTPDGGDVEHPIVLVNGEGAKAKAEKRFLYRGQWKFSASCTLKFEATLQSGVAVKIASHLKSVRQPRKSRVARRKKAPVGKGSSTLA